MGVTDNVIRTPQKLIDKIVSLSLPPNQQARERDWV